MSPAVLDRPLLRGAASAQLLLGEQRPAGGASARVGDAPVRDRATAVHAQAAPAARAATVGDVISRAWQELGAHQAVACPLCSGVMTPRYGAAGVAPVGGRCTDCGTTIG